MRKLIVKAIMYVVGFLWIVSACAIDSPSWTPFIVNVVLMRNPLRTRSIPLLVRPLSRSSYEKGWCAG